MGVMSADAMSITDSKMRACYDCPFGAENAHNGQSAKMAEFCPRCSECRSRHKRKERND
jgi:hypothetical protein